VSNGEDCGLPNKPGVYADVVFYKEWIEEKIRVGKDEL
jgi:secreted trypsin-like serine protease